jgi:hypothetical protein
MILEVFTGVILAEICKDIYQEYIKRKYKEMKRWTKKHTDNLIESKQK